MIISAAEEMNPTRRFTMEDCHVYHEANSWNCGHEDLSFLGVYDGHGGRDIVDFLEVNLAKTIAQELRQDDNASILEKIERGFLLTDIMSHRAGILVSGATVVVCLVKKSVTGTTIYAANCGDARAVVCTRNKHDGTITATRLTHDHRANDPVEQQRIESAGGIVVRNRVMGILAVARSLGDHGVKEFVIARPHLKTFHVQEAAVVDTVVLILACDGLWDVLQDEEVGDLLMRSTATTVDNNNNNASSSTNNNNNEEVERLHRIKTDSAQVLVNEAIKRGSGDNITVLISWLIP